MPTSADTLPLAEQETFAEQKKRLFEDDMRQLADKARDQGVGVNLDLTEAEMAEESAEEQRDEVSETHLREVAPQLARSEGVTQSWTYIRSRPVDQLLADRWGEVTDDRARIYGGKKIYSKSLFTGKGLVESDLAFLGPATTRSEKGPPFKNDPEYSIFKVYEFNDTPFQKRDLVLGKLVFALRHLRPPKP